MDRKGRRTRKIVDSVARPHRQDRGGESKRGNRSMCYTPTAPTQTDTRPITDSDTYVHTYDTIRDDTYDTTVIIYGTHTHIQSVVRYEYDTYDTTVEIYDTGVMIDPIRHYVLQYEESAVGRMADLSSSYTCLHLAFDSVHIRQDSMQPLWANAF